MNKVEFDYASAKTIIQCNDDEKMGDIINKYLSKIGKKKKIFIYYTTD